MAKNPSAYFTAIPKKDAKTIQKRAPGPPAAKAVATPMMLPVPKVAAREVQRAAKGETSPAPPSPRPMALKAAPNFRAEINRVPKVNQTPTPKTNANIHGPQTIPAIRSNIDRSPILSISQHNSIALEPFLFLSRCTIHLCRRRQIPLNTIYLYSAAQFICAKGGKFRSVQFICTLLHNSFVQKEANCGGQK
jgi:hypothetical protein